MTRDEFQSHQRQTFRHAMSSLLGDCRHRFLLAGRLLEVGGQVIEQLERSRTDGVTDLSPLLPVWDLVCSRYREECLSLQEDLFAEGDDQFTKPWSEFIYWHLFPELRRDDRFVRNTLRAVGLLPSGPNNDPVQALVAELTEMTLPTGRPAYYEYDMDL